MSALPCIIKGMGNPRVIGSKYPHPPPVTSSLRWFTEPSVRIGVM